MKDIRIGNDIKIAWSLFNEGVAFPLEGLNLHVYLRDKFGRKEINDFLVSGNKIEWTFYGKNQRRTGVYSLELVINEGEDGMITTDACQFVNLVPCTCKVSGADDKGVRTETIELTSTLEYVAGGGKYDDPEVKNELARLEREKADKSELTELSAEVGGLSEKIDNLPSGESSVFEAVYNKTTFAEIVEAYNAGKSVTCRYGQTIAQLISITDSVIYFTSIDIKKEVRFICYSSNLWTYSEHNTGHELKTLDNGNAQITIAGKTAEVATPQYVENLLGTIINGDY